MNLSLRTLSFRVVAAAVSGAIALSAIAGCQSGNRTAASTVASGGSGGSRSAPPVDHDAWADLGYRLVWRGFPVMSRGGSVIYFDVFDDVVVSHDSSNIVTVLETQSGRNRWSNVLGARLTRFLGNSRVNDTLYCSSDNELFILDIRTGEIAAKHDLAMVVNTKPVISENVAVFGTTRGEALGHSLITGYKQWGYLLRGAIDAHPTLLGRLVGVVSQSGDVIVIDPATGSSTARYSIFGGLANEPVGDSSVMYVAGLDQSVWAFATDTTRTLWRHRAQAPIRSQPALHVDTLYVEIPRDGFTAFDAVSGEILWSAPDVRGRAVAMRAGRLLVWDGRTAWALDPERGDVLHTVATPNVHMMRTTKFEDGDLYTVTRNGVVAKFVPGI